FLSPVTCATQRLYLVRPSIDGSSKSRLSAKQPQEAPSDVYTRRPSGLPHEPSPSTFVLRRIESILYPQSYCPCAPLPATLQLRFRRLSFERVRTPHHAALSNAPSAYRPLDDGCRGWRNQHGITGRQLPRSLLFPGQGCEGRLGGRNPADPAERNHPCRPGSRTLPRTRAAHRN